MLNSPPVYSKPVRFDQILDLHKTNPQSQNVSIANSAYVRDSSDLSLEVMAAIKVKRQLRNTHVCI